MSDRDDREPLATARDVRRAMWAIIAAIALGTLLVILTLKNVFPGL